MRVERAVQRAELIGRGGGDLAQQEHASFHLRVAARQDLERADQLLPIAARLVDRLEDRGGFGAQRFALEHALEGQARAFVVGVDEQNLAVVLERARFVAQVFELGLRRGGT